MTATNKIWKIVLICLLLTSLLTGCGGASTDVTLEASSTPVTVSLPTATTTHQEGLLSIITPLEGKEMLGGESLRVYLYFVDPDNTPIEGATVQAYLWSPGGELFASLACMDKGAGRYLSDYISLPLRGASGTWRITGSASRKDDHQVETESRFQANPSISEMYQNRHGFWVEYPHIFSLGIGAYNLSESGGLHFEDWQHDDGSGYVILDNYRYIAIGITFATLEVHWQDAAFPSSEATAIARAQSLVGPGLHHQEPGIPLSDLSAQMVEFQALRAWQVFGHGQEYYVSKAAAEYPIEFMIFECPGSDRLWSLVTATDREAYMNHLRAIRQTFECPPINSN